MQLLNSYSKIEGYSGILPYVSPRTCPQLSLSRIVSSNSRIPCIPIVKVHERKTWMPFRMHRENVPVIFVKAEEFLRRNGKRTNRFYDTVVKAGGLHVYLNYSGVIILSSVMRDQTCSGLDVDIYSTLIQNLKPDGFMTPDEGVYMDEPVYAQTRIERVLSMTKILAAKHPDKLMYGLLKGATKEQYLWHLQQLSDLGITHYVFHLGDYTHNGKKVEFQSALRFASAINEQAPNLLIYGIGSRRYMRWFAFADGIVTQSHIVEPYHHVFTDSYEQGPKKSRDTREITSEDIWNTFQRVCRDWDDQAKQMTLGSCMLGGQVLKTAEWNCGCVRCF